MQEKLNSKCKLGVILGSSLVYLILNSRNNAVAFNMAAVLKDAAAIVEFLIQYVSASTPLHVNWRQMNKT